MPKFQIHVPIRSASGSQTFQVEAENKEAAELFLAGKDDAARNIRAIGEHIKRSEHTYFPA